MSYSEKIKRKAYETLEYFLVLFIEDDTFSIISSKQIKLSEHDSGVGIVKFKGKNYQVEVIKRGSYEYCVEKSKYFQVNLSVETADEEEANKKLKSFDQTKHSRINSLKRSNAFNGEEEYEDLNLMSSNLCKNFDQCETKEKSKLSGLKCSDKLFEEEEQSNSFSKSIENLAIENYESSLQQEKFQKNPFETMPFTHEEISELKKKVDELNKKVSEKNKEKKFVFDNVDLVNDVGGKTCVKWALNVSKILFTKRELIDSVVTSSSKSNRGALDKERVKLLKDAFIEKYDYPVDKREKAWNAIRDAINTSGRNFKFQEQLSNLKKTLLGEKSSFRD